MMHGSGFNNVTIKDSQTPWVCLYVLWFPCKRRPANLEATLKHFNVLCRSSVPLLVSFWDSSKYNEVSLRWMKWNTLQLQKVSSQANIDRFLHFCVRLVQTLKRAYPYCWRDVMPECSLWSRVVSAKRKKQRLIHQFVTGVLFKFILINSLQFLSLQ